MRREDDFLDQKQIGVGRAQSARCHQQWQPIDHLEESDGTGTDRDGSEERGHRCGRKKALILALVAARNVLRKDRSNLFLCDIKIQIHEEKQASSLPPPVCAVRSKQ